MKELDTQILRIAVPSIVSNVTVPLLGIVDTAITGHLGAASFIAAIAVGTSIFSLCYWLFSFLRMGTGGLTAQAFGAEAWDVCREVLRKAMTIAVIAAASIIALQMFIADAALWLMHASPEVEYWARVYFHILVWGAPANLGLSVLNGWLIGMQDAKSPMIIAVAQNELNIMLSLVLVFGYGWKVEGVATGTLVAQWAGFVLAIYLSRRHFRAHFLGKAKTLQFANTADSSIETDTSVVSSAVPLPMTPPAITWRKFFNVNRDIFLRTLCLIAVMFSFTAFGARQGENVLAVNALLMQMFLFVSYVMDGFAYAAEAIGGSLLGTNNLIAFRRLVRRLFVWGTAVSLAFCFFFTFAGSSVVRLLTDNAVVRTTALQYLWTTIVIPLISIGAFIYDGLFIGTTSTRQMLQSIAVATIAYFVVALNAPNNQWLWTAFLLYMALRGFVQHLLMPNVIRRSFK